MTSAMSNLANAKRELMLAERAVDGERALEWLKAYSIGFKSNSSDAASVRVEVAYAKHTANQAEAQKFINAAAQSMLWEIIEEAQRRAEGAVLDAGLDPAKQHKD